MLAKLDNYKGVILFYLILILIFGVLAYRSKQIDMHISTNSSGFSQTSGKFFCS